MKKISILLLVAFLFASCSQKITQPLKTDFDGIIQAEKPKTEFKNQYLVWCYVVSVHDGDTVEILFESGVNNWQIWSTRLLYIDAPEVRGKEKEIGFITRDWLADQVLGKWILAEMPQYNLDKFGRLLVELYQPNTNDFEMSINLNQKMLELGLVKPYTLSQILQETDP